MMDFFQTIEARQSIRAFTSAPVEPEKLQAILDAAVNQSPSAGNLQAYQVYVLTNAVDRQALSGVAIGRRGTPQTFVAEAPVVLVFCADPERSAQQYGQRGRELYAIQDATIACTYASLAAAALGLGSCFVGSFDPEGVRRVIGAREGITPITILPIGYPASRPPRRQRRPMGELIHEVRR